MMEQLGKEPELDKIPIDYEDLHGDCQVALYIYNKLGNRVYGDVGFTGKDFTLLPTLIAYHKIIDPDLLIDYLNTIDNHHINESQKAIKAEYDKIKNKK